MPETLEKLRPDRDLQCYFERPSAIAALHDASAAGFTISGTWRQQFDWAVLEWNRDNVFEHPMFRNLPDGDLSGLLLTYEETRSSCITLDSDLYPTVDWPYLRIWADDGSGEKFYQVRLKDYATPTEGGYSSAFAEFELQGSPTAGDYIGLAFLTENHTYQLYAVDTLETAVQALVDSVNAFSTQFRAMRDGARIRLTYVGEGQSPETSTTGADGNRIGAYGFAAGAKTESWYPQWQYFSGGVSPIKWRVTLPLSGLTAIDGTPVPTNAVRKMRWTYAADFQNGEFQRSEFEVKVTNWSVTGLNRTYCVAGAGSRRIEDDSESVKYFGEWSQAKGNFSGGTIHFSVNSSAGLQLEYTSPLQHSLYLGSRKAFNGAQISIVVDQQSPCIENLLIPGEDVLTRIPLGQFGAGSHRVSITHAGPQGSFFYFDFVELALATTSLPVIVSEEKLALATDWDTDHSIALAAERTAWLIHSLGFRGRANHYVGALWFYELTRLGHQYASATIDFTGTPEFSQTTEIIVGRVGEPPEKQIVISHLNLIGDTAESIAKAFELEINRGYTAIRAEGEGTRLTIYARGMGEDGNNITISASPTSGTFALHLSGSTLSGGTNGDWRTDLLASPRLNRAVRGWSRSFYAALKNYGLDAVAAFSMELQHGDPSEMGGIAQRYPNGEAVILTTPALQTNFSPESVAFWREVYLEMASLLSEAGHVPYMQFGEVQWWYFPLAGSGMPFYDEYTKSAFQAAYGREMRIISDNAVDPADFIEETQFLPQLIENFTVAIINYVRSLHPNSRFEVLYPTDVNETAFNGLINYPTATWTSSNLSCLKTESFTYTYTRNLDLSRGTIEHGKSLGFSPSKRSFLVGISDSTTTWIKEVRLALAEGVESVVLFALDQFCLIGYEAPLPKGMRRTAFQG
jgi:hypothetical protein